MDNRIYQRTTFLKAIGKPYINLVGDGKISITMQFEQALNKLTFESENPEIMGQVAVHYIVTDAEVKAKGLYKIIEEKMAADPSLNLVTE